MGGAGGVGGVGGATGGSAGQAAQGPSINDVAGAITQGGTLEINGSGFGTKSTAAPLRYDDFEKGILGERIPNNQDGGGWSTNSPNYPTYSDAVARYPGRQSALQSFGTYYGQSLSLDNRENSGTTIPPGTKEMYVTGWFWMETGGAPSRNVKIINMGTGAGWQTRIDVYPSTSSGHLYAHGSTTCEDSSTYIHDWSAKPNNVMLPDKKWHRIETYLRIGANGYRDVWVDGVKIAEISGGFTGESCDIGYLLIGHYFATDTGTPKPWAKRYWDELYVDTTMARVEIGDAPIWEDCKHKEVQIPSAWSDTSIMLTANLGSFQPGSPVYVYVVDADGNVNHDGFSP